METKETKSSGLVWLIVALAAISAISSAWIIMSDKEVSVPAPVITDQDKAEIANLVLSNLPAPAPVSAAPSAPAPTQTITVPPAELSEEDREYLKDLSDLDEERKAEEFCLADLDSREFRKALTSFLNDNGTNIESYKDISDISVDDDETDVDVDDETAVCSLRFKVKYFEDGDTDDSDLEAAKVTAELTVEDLDEDEEYEDAEINENSYAFSLVKFYE